MENLNISFSSEETASSSREKRRTNASRTPTEGGSPRRGGDTGGHAGSEQRPESDNHASPPSSNSPQSNPEATGNSLGSIPDQSQERDNASSNHLPQFNPSAADNKLRSIQDPKRNKRPPTSDKPRPIRDRGLQRSPSLSLNQSASAEQPPRPKDKAQKEKTLRREMIIEPVVHDDNSGHGPRVFGRAVERWVETSENGSSASWEDASTSSIKSTDIMDHLKPDIEDD